MCKRDVIDEIMRINLSAKASFLAEFSLEDLKAYLQHLRVTQTPRPLACLYAGGTPPVRPDGCPPDGEPAAHRPRQAECAQAAMLF